MPEYKYSTGWDSYDYDGCKCIQMEFVETEIDKLICMQIWLVQQKKLFI